MRSDSRGLTLIELLVVVAIFAVVVAASISILSAGTKVFARETASVSVNEALAAAKDVFLDDMSIAGYQSTFNAAATPPITAVSPTFVAVTTGTTSDAVTFDGDIDSNGSVDRVCYRVSAGALQRKVVTPAAACGTTGFDTLVTGVTAFTLTFLDASRTTQTATQVTTSNVTRYVDFMLTVSTPGGIIGNVAKTLYGEVAIRNF